MLSLCSFMTISIHKGESRWHSSHVTPTFGCWSEICLGIELWNACYCRYEFMSRVTTSLEVQDVCKKVPHCSRHWSKGGQCVSCCKPVAIRFESLERTFSAAGWPLGLEKKWKHPSTFLNSEECQSACKHHNNRTQQSPCAMWQTKWWT